MKVLKNPDCVQVCIAGIKMLALKVSTTCNGNCILKQLSKLCTIPVISKIYVGIPSSVVTVQSSACIHLLLKSLCSSWQKVEGNTKFML